MINDLNSSKLGPAEWPKEAPLIQKATTQGRQRKQLRGK
jgi:hypothetical protein